MLRKYIENALQTAKYEIIEDDNTFYGEIPQCQGVWANSANLEDCRNELAEVLEEWILFRVSEKQELPIIGGLELAIKNVG